MSILSSMGEGKKFKLPDGKEIELKSVHVDEDSAKLIEGGKNIPVIEQMEMQKKLIKKMMKEAVPDATEEELNDCVRMKNLMALMEVFYEVNGMNRDKKSGAGNIQNVLERRRAAIAAAKTPTA